MNLDVVPKVWRLKDGNPGPTSFSSPTPGSKIHDRLSLILQMSSVNTNQETIARLARIWPLSNVAASLSVYLPAHKTRPRTIEAAPQLNTVRTRSHPDLQTESGPLKRRPRRAHRHTIADPYVTASSLPRGSERQLAPWPWRKCGDGIRDDRWLSTLPAIRPSALSYRNCGQRVASRHRCRVSGTFGRGRPCRRLTFHGTQGTAYF
jgi:hypothetical protein